MPINSSTGRYNLPHIEDSRKIIKKSKGEKIAISKGIKIHGALMGFIRALFGGNAFKIKDENNKTRWLNVGSAKHFFEENKHLPVEAVNKFQFKKIVKISSRGLAEILNEILHPKKMAIKDLKPTVFNPGPNQPDLQKLPLGQKKTDFPPVISKPQEEPVKPSAAPESEKLPPSNTDTHDSPPLISKLPEEPVTLPAHLEPEKLPPSNHEALAVQPAAPEPEPFHADTPDSPLPPLNLLERPATPPASPQPEPLPPSNTDTAHVEISDEEMAFLQAFAAQEEIYTQQTFLGDDDLELQRLLALTMQAPQEIGNLVAEPKDLIHRYKSELDENIPENERWMKQTIEKSRLRDTHEIMQVRGDGNCLFYALNAGMHYALMQIPEQVISNEVITYPRNEVITKLKNKFENFGNAASDPETNKFKDLTARLDDLFIIHEEIKNGQTIASVMNRNLTVETGDDAAPIKKLGESSSAFLREFTAHIFTSPKNIELMDITGSTDLEQLAANYRRDRLEVDLRALDAFAKALNLDITVHSFSPDEGGKTFIVYPEPWSVAIEKPVLRLDLLLFRGHYDLLIPKPIN